MNKPPAFQFYAQDFLTGVVFLTNEEVGIYIRILSKQWTDGKIPLKRLNLLIGKDWEELSEELRTKFKTKNGFIWNKRLKTQYLELIEFRQKQSKNGSKGGRPKTQTKPKQNPKQSSSSSTSSSTSKSNIIFTKKDWKKTLIELGAETDHIKDWFTVRDKKRASFTQTALSRFINECEKHKYPIADAVQKCAENSWSGFKYDWLEDNEKNITAAKKSHKKFELDG